MAGSSHQSYYSSSTHPRYTANRATPRATYQNNRNNNSYIPQARNNNNQAVNWYQNNNTNTRDSYNNVPYNQAAYSQHNNTNNNNNNTNHFNNNNNNNNNSNTASTEHLQFSSPQKVKPFNLPINQENRYTSIRKHNALLGLHDREIQLTNYDQVIHPDLVEHVLPPPPPPPPPPLNDFSRPPSPPPAAKRHHDTREYSRPFDPASKLSRDHDIIARQPLFPSDHAPGNTYPHIMSLQLYKRTKPYTKGAKYDIESRNRLVSYIQECSHELSCRQGTTYSAIIYAQRFYCKFEFEEADYCEVGAAALLIATKTSENTRKLSQLAVITLAVAHQVEPSTLLQNQEVLTQWRDIITYHEEWTLEVLAFDLYVDSPYEHTEMVRERLCKAANLPSKTYATVLFGVLNDLLHTSLPLRYPGRVLGLAAASFAVMLITRDDNIIDKPEILEILQIERAPLLAIITEILELLSSYYNNDIMRLGHTKYVEMYRNLSVHTNDISASLLAVPIGADDVDLGAATPHSRRESVGTPRTHVDENRSQGGITPAANTLDIDLF